MSRGVGVLLSVLAVLQTDVRASCLAADRWTEARPAETVRAARYWVGGGGDWTDAAHWADASGGNGGTGAPGAGDAGSCTGRTSPQDSP